MASMLSLHCSLAPASLRQRNCEALKTGGGYCGLVFTSRVNAVGGCRKGLSTEACRVPLQRVKGTFRKLVVAEYRRESGASDFISGFLLGGVVFGTLAFVFSPQISRTVLGENPDGTPRRLPRWMDEEDSLEETRRKMNEKIAELNLAIDNTSAQLRADGGDQERIYSEPVEQTS